MGLRRTSRPTAKLGGVPPPQEIEVGKVRGPCKLSATGLERRLELSNSRQQGE